MAPAAMGAAPTSTPHLQALPLTLQNTAVATFWDNQHTDACFIKPPSTSTASLVQLCIENPMVHDSDLNLHHESCQPVDLMEI